MVRLLQHRQQLNHSSWLCAHSWPTAKAQRATRKDMKGALSYPNKCPNHRDRAMGILSPSPSLQTFSTFGTKIYPWCKSFLANQPCLANKIPSVLLFSGNLSLPVCRPAGTELHLPAATPSSPSKPLVYTRAGSQGLWPSFKIYRIFAAPGCSYTEKLNLRSKKITSWWY